MKTSLIKGKTDGPLQPTCVSFQFPCIRYLQIIRVFDASPPLRINGIFMGPLSDIKVLELGTLIAGPFCSRMLAEFGAQVIKIEAPDGGDPLRQWRKLHHGTSLWWYLQARNKKSVTVNMREPEGQQIVRELAAKADIVIENFRPGTLEKWGLGWEELSKLNPGLVLVRLSGYGQTGPYRERVGF